jgi:hypothetical protein
MNIWGKVFVWFTVVAGVAAMLLTARTFEVRNSWIRQATELKAKNEKNALEIAQKSKQLKHQRAELARTMLGWDMYWQDVPVQVVNPQNGEVRADFGKRHGFGFPDKPVPPLAYAFRSLPDGSGSQYIGVFQPPDARNLHETHTEFGPAWRMGPNDVERIGQGQQKWRFRSLIPPRFVEQFSDYEIALTLADEQYFEQEQNIADQQKLDQAAQGQLDYRLAELNGSPEMLQYDGKLPIEKVHGLQAAIAEEEERRNAALLEMHRLRRELKETYHRFEQLRKENLAFIAGLIDVASGKKSAQENTSVVTNP